MATRNTHSRSSESGTTMVQAALVLPLFMAVLLGSLRMLLICYQGIRLQYDVSETTRMTFTLDSAARGGKKWEDFFGSTLETRSAKSGLSGLKFGVSVDTGNPMPGKRCDPSNLLLKYKGQATTTWPSASAKPGETVSLDIITNEPLLPNGLGGVRSPTIQLRARAVAVLHRGENE